MKILCISLLVANAVAIFSLARGKKLGRLTIALVACAYLLWFALPTLICVTLPALAAESRPVTEDVFLYGMAKQLSCLLGTLVLVHLFRFGGELVRKSCAKFPAGDSSFEPVAAIGAMFVVVIASVLAGNMGGSDYLARNAFLSSSDPGDLVGAGVAGLVAGVATAYIYAFAVGIDGRPGSRRSGPRQSGASMSRIALSGSIWLFVVLFAISQVQAGSRINVMLPAFLFALWLVNRYQFTKKAFTIGFILLLVNVPVTFYVSVNISELRQRGSFSVTEVFRDSGVESLSDKVLRLLNEFAMKFDSVSTGEVFLDSRGGGSAGWTPIAGSLCSLVPRALYPNKPVPGSEDGTYYGVPAYVTARILGGGEGTNVGISQVVIAQWELGYFGLIVLCFLSWSWISICDQFLSDGRMYSRAIGLYMIGLPVCGNVLIPLGYFLLWGQRVVVLVVVGIVLGALWRRNRGPHCVENVQSGLRMRRVA